MNLLTSMFFLFLISPHPAFAEGIPRGESSGGSTSLPHDQSAKVKNSYQSHGMCKGLDGTLQLLYGDLGAGKRHQVMARITRANGQDVSIMLHINTQDTDFPKWKKKFARISGLHLAPPNQNDSREYDAEVSLSDVETATDSDFLLKIQKQLKGQKIHCSYSQINPQGLEKSP